jgi:hypothetical protein
MSMPISRRSRYAQTPTIAAPGRNGRSNAVAVTIRRQAPTPLVEGQTYRHLLSAEENIEYLAWRYFGTSEDWWRIADTNPTTYPLDILPGSSLTIFSDSATARVQRSRTF